MTRCTLEFVAVLIVCMLPNNTCTVKLRYNGFLGTENISML